MLSNSNNNNNNWTPFRWMRTKSCNGPSTAVAQLQAQISRQNRKATADYAKWQPTVVVIVVMACLRWVDFHSIVEFHLRNRSIECTLELLDAMFSNKWQTSCDERTWKTSSSCSFLYVQVFSWAEFRRLENAATQNSHRALKSLAIWAHWAQNRKVDFGRSKRVNFLILLESNIIIIIISSRRHFCAIERRQWSEPRGSN